MLHETDSAQQRALMRQFERYVLDKQTHENHDAIVVPDRPPPFLCQGLEDRPEPIRQSGSGDDLAPQMSSRLTAFARMALLASGLCAAPAAAAETAKPGGMLT